MAINYDKIIREYELNCQQIIHAASLEAGESPDRKFRRIKQTEARYTDWFAYYLSHYATCEPASYHIEIAGILIKNPVVKVLLDIYRAGAKSVHVAIGMPLYLALVKKELWFMLLIGENEEKAIRLLSDIQAEMKFNTRIMNDYGEQFKVGDWSEGNFTTKDGVHFHALGFGQDPRGLRHGEHRPDYIACDDIDNLRRCNNDRLIREAVDYVTGTLWGCFDKGKERFIFCNNLIHKNSIMAKLIELCNAANREAKAQNLPKTFWHFKVKAVLDDNFTPSWPGKYTADYWREKRASTPYRSWMREYMCTPLVDGAIFNPEWMQYKKMLPLAKYDALIMYGDLSYKDRGDYKALVLVGKTGREFHVIHSFVKQTSRAVCASWLYNLYEKRKLEQYNIDYLIEGLFAQDEFVNDFDTEGDRRGYYIPVVADKKPKGNKFDRIESMAGHFERMYVFFNESEKENSGQINLIDQLLAFEKGSGANDDGPDALQSAMAELNKATFVSSFEIKTTPRKTFNKYRF
ncbi:MAG: phage terminase large subunit [Tannerella sp.]|jgi:predicted phage terminase large subunit-like protein|nr:phage terminase large subunit [Tannerella sp.]